MITSRNVSLIDFLNLDSIYTPKSNTFFCHIRGTNGSGKSTIPQNILEQDNNRFNLVSYNINSEKVVSVVSPKFNLITLGNYSGKTGGADSLNTLDKIEELLIKYSPTNYNLLVEGAMLSTIKERMGKMFTYYMSNTTKRCISFNIVVPLEINLQRIYQRNGGKPVKKDNVRLKWKTTKRYIPFFKEIGAEVYEVDNRGVDLNEIPNWFFKTINWSDKDASNTPN